ARSGRAGAGTRLRSRNPYGLFRWLRDRPDVRAGRWILSNLAGALTLGGWAALSPAATPAAMPYNTPASADLGGWKRTGKSRETGRRKRSPLMHSRSPCPESGLIGGGCNINLVRVALPVESKAVRKTTGKCTETLSRVSWDVSELSGRTARMLIKGNRVTGKRSPGKSRFL
ncbi:MAG: hypothetical protein ACE5JS_22835, partial [Nitrospinota bacterium]